MTSRNFQPRTATRGAIPLLVSLYGPSSGGKTYSGLRLLTGAQRVLGGKIGVIDTESRRATHYAKKFAFEHLDFGEPFGPADYWEAIEAMQAAGCKCILVDSMSHEHEGVGGVLEMHDAEVQRMVGRGMTEGAAQFPAWAMPKGQRRRLLQRILQLGDIAIVFCFRSKKKVRLPSKEERQAGFKEPIPLGWMPITGEEFIYEMTAAMSLPPGARGVPDWSPRPPETEAITKRPEAFESILTDGRQLSEEVGEAMARWAAGKETVHGGEKAKVSLTERGTAFMARLKGCPDLTELQRIADDIIDANDLNQAETALLQKARDRREKQLKEGAEQEAAAGAQA